jgi:hypothetical protein
MIFRSKIYTYSKTPNICRNNISNGSNHLGTRFCLYVHHTDADRDAKTSQFPIVVMRCVPRLRFGGHASRIVAFASAVAGASGGGHASKDRPGLMVCGRGLLQKRDQYSAYRFA